MNLYSDNGLLTMCRFFSTFINFDDFLSFPFQNNDFLFFQLWFKGLSSGRIWVAVMRIECCILDTIVVGHVVLLNGIDFVQLASEYKNNNSEQKRKKRKNQKNLTSSVALYLSILCFDFLSLLYERMISQQETFKCKISSIY